MPWSPAQHRLFCAAMANTKRGMAIRKKHGIKQHEAKKMCHEGIAKDLAKQKK